MAVITTFLVTLCIFTRKAVVATPVSSIDGDSTACNTQACKEAVSQLQDSMNISVDPCQDFYEYACGGWIAKHPIPDDKVRYSAFDILRDQLSKSLSGLLDEDRTESKRPSREVKSEGAKDAVKDAKILFRGCVDEDARQKQGIEPLKHMLKKYNGWPMLGKQWNETGYQWYLEVARMIRDLGKSMILSISVGADSKNTSRNIIYISEAKFGLGRNQLINLTSSNRNEEIVAAYKKYIKSSAELLNSDSDEAQLTTDIEEMLKFESSLAKLTKSPEEQRNASSLYNKMTVKEMQDMIQGETFDWKSFLNTLFQEYASITDDTEIVVSDVNYMKNAIKLAYNTKSRTLANYIATQAVLTFGSQTTREFRQNTFEFNKVSTGIQKIPELRSGCLDLAVSLLDFSVGRLYVDEYFAEEAKHDVENMVEEIRSAYFATLKNSAWLNEATKSEAISKLESMISMMAYPQWIKNDEELNEYYKEVGELREDKYFSSLLSVTTAVVGKALKKVNQPTNRTSEWLTSPAIVNAFYNPSANTITFPAGILNTPFYKYNRALSLNFGGIGSVIGHEVSHGFDDEGSQFDKDGNINDWWSKEVREKFEEKAQCFRDQYSSYTEPLTQMKLNGNNSIGENIADNAGLQSSYIAYKLKTMLSEENSIEDKQLPGISATCDQLFFIGYANVWCGSERKEAMEMTIQYNTHSPNRYRVMVPLANFKAFSEAFNCPLGSPMNPKTKCALW